MNFYITILIAISIFIAPFILKKWYSKTELSSFATIVGILGTFVGITLGLWSFDTKDIQNSIPTLLGGLTTAFVTSIAGMAASLVLRMKPEFYGVTVSNNVKKEANIETLIHILSEISENQKIANQSLIKSLTGDGDSTIITQIQKLRTATSDGLYDLNKSFNSFAEKMVADSTQSLIDALTGVMTDFNSKINEQFGENFKELNSGVKLMLDWQKNYKEQIEISVNMINDTSSALNSIDSSISKLSSNSHILVEASQGMNEMLLNITDGLSGLSVLGENARESLPKINSNIELLTTNFTERIKSSIDEIQKQGTLLTDSQDKIRESTLKRIDTVNSSIEKQFKELDEALSKELTKALEALGNQLASVSNKFVQDYIPLTNKLRDVVHIANKFELNN